MRQLKRPVTNQVRLTSPRHEYNTNGIPLIIFLLYQIKKLGIAFLTPPPNTPLNNFLIGKRSIISHTILGAIEIDNDSANLNKLFSSINIEDTPFIHYHRIPHSTSQNKLFKYLSTINTLNPIHPIPFQHLSPPYL